MTSAQIARRAGVATGTFYLHFADKEALFHEIAFAALAELRARQERASAGLALGSREYLRARTEEFLDFAEEKRELIRMVFGRAESAGLADEVREAVRAGDPALARAPRGRGPRARATCTPASPRRRTPPCSTRVIAWWVEDPSRATRDEVVATLLST